MPSQRHMRAPNAERVEELRECVLRRGVRIRKHRKRQPQVALAENMISARNSRKTQRCLAPFALLTVPTANI